MCGRGCMCHDNLPPISCPVRDVACETPRLPHCVPHVASIRTVTSCVKGHGDTARCPRGTGFGPGKVSPRDVRHQSCRHFRDRGAGLGPEEIAEARRLQGLPAWPVRSWPRARSQEAPGCLGTHWGVWAGDAAAPPGAGGPPPSIWKRGLVVPVPFGPGAPLARVSGYGLHRTAVRIRRTRHRPTGATRPCGLDSGRFGALYAGARRLPAQGAGRARAGGPLDVRTRGGRACEVLGLVRSGRYGSG